MVPRSGAGSLTSPMDRDALGRESAVLTDSGPVAIVQAPDVARVVHQTSRRVIRKLRKLGSLESGIDAAVATGHDPLVHHEPEPARTLAASVQPRIPS